MNAKQRRKAERKHSRLVKEFAGLIFKLADQIEAGMTQEEYLQGANDLRDALRRDGYQDKRGGE